jgi:hypothetical protein
MLLKKVYQKCQEKMMLKIFLFVFVICSFLFIGLYSTKKKETFPYASNSQDVQFYLKEQTQSATVQRFAYSIHSGAIEGEAKLTYAPTIEMGNMIVNAYILGVQSTFEASRAPYAGHVTELIECQNQKYFKEKEIIFLKTKTRLLLAVANGRRLTGSCTVDQIKYVSIFWAGYDEIKKQVVTIQLFKPISDLNNVDEYQEILLQTFNIIMGIGSEN